MEHWSELQKSNTEQQMEAHKKRGSGNDSYKVPEMYSQVYYKTAKYYIQLHKIWLEV